MNSKVKMGLRIVLGIFMLTFGLNKFINFMPFPPMGDVANTLMGIYVDSGFIKLIGVLEVVFGLALALGKYIPLALTILIAILFNATLFHAFHNMENIVGALVGLVLAIVLVYVHKDRFKDLLSA